MIYFTTKIRYDKTTDDGSVKKVTESYLLDAVSFSEAEKRITSDMPELISGDFEVSAIAKKDYQEIVLSNNDKDDKYYEVKYKVKEINENNGKEKSTSYVLLVQASNIETAKRYFDEHMKDTVYDFEVSSLRETDYMDYYF
jgi:hypothetical protein